MGRNLSAEHGRHLLTTQTQAKYKNVKILPFCKKQGKLLCYLVSARIRHQRLLSSCTEENVSCPFAQAKEESGKCPTVALPVA